MDKDIAQGCNRPLRVRLEQQSAVPQARVGGAPAAVVYMPGPVCSKAQSRQKGAALTHVRSCLRCSSATSSGTTVGSVYSPRPGCWTAPERTARRRAASSIPKRARDGRLAAPPQMFRAFTTSMGYHVALQTWSAVPGRHAMWTARRHTRQILGDFKTLGPPGARRYRTGKEPKGCCP
jgi:hypothetical protein